MVGAVAHEMSDSPISCYILLSVSSGIRKASQAAKKAIDSRTSRCTGFLGTPEAIVI